MAAWTEVASLAIICGTGLVVFTAILNFFNNCADRCAERERRESIDRESL